jgi:hypothetical protein
MSDQPVAKASTYKGTQERKTKTNINVLSGIRNHDLSIQTIKAYASASADMGPAQIFYTKNYFRNVLKHRLILYSKEKVPEHHVKNL